MLSVWLAVTAWVAFGLGIPIVMQFDAADMVGPSTVVAASRDTYVIDRQVVLSRLPGVTLERGTVVLAAGARETLPAATVAVRSARNLVLENAQLTLAARRAAPTENGRPAARVSDPDAEAPLVVALEAASYETLLLKRSALSIRLAGANVESITDVDAVVQIKRKGVVNAKGSGKVRGRKVDFDIALGGAAAGRDGGVAKTLPIKISVKAGFAHAAFEGRMDIADEIELRGPGEIVVDSGREMARWFGAYWLSGPGLRGIKARGQVTIAKGALAFDKADFQMDGNHATGALALRFDKQRPELSGTLAAKTLDATGYLGEESKPGVRSRDVLTWASLATGALTVPLGMHLDADVRISADALKCGSVEMNATAAAISLKDGRLLADFAEVKLGWGTGGGQIVADFTGFVPKVAMRGKLENVELGHLVKLMSDAPLMKGAATVVADLSSSGFTVQDLIAGLSGKITVSGAEGRLGLDLGKLGAVAKLPTLDSGWGDAAKGSTALDKYNLKLVFRDGVALTEVAEAQSGAAGWSATGLLNLRSSRIDLRLAQARPESGGRSSLQPMPSVVEVRGPWDRPVVKPVGGLD